jgi:PPK2 family polyphosphate:nucleotide phosphotransferase
MKLSKRDLELMRSLTRPYRLTSGKRFRLKDYNPRDTLHFGSADKPGAQAGLRRGVELLAKLQDILYAQDRWSVLLIFQAMDAAGKDSAIKHVFSGVNPQGCEVSSFKAPSAEELDHDFLWRCAKRLPERGRIGIFNRSYYEETLVARVHPEVLDGQRLPPRLVTRKIWKERLQDINAFETHLARNGTLVIKFFLHVSRAEQKRRFLERIGNPDKNWKFSSADLRERALWHDYMSAYQHTIRATATQQAPWYVVPADNKWFTRTVVVAAIIEGLLSLNLEYPRLDSNQMLALKNAHAELLAE